MNTKTHMKWSWVLIVSFFVLSILDIRFGILGVICIGAPIYHALKGRGKIHCSKYCPRGSFLGKFLANISFNNNLPKGINTKTFKNILLVLMIAMFGISLFHAGLDYKKIAFSIFRLMLSSFVIGILMGVIFRPRSWCIVCPMGHATGLIKKAKELKEISQDLGDRENPNRAA